ncbi:Hypothetical predicted protein [Paramuricea clavata]|uniref:Uncharacterized protein n=1 Tax=Paramuricea clavata TaxID=317549 RepID=A0A7D9EGV1_PARCT|nr:Hypothetical predicted protein [Paramuricea clavata]
MLKMRYGDRRAEAHGALKAKAMIYLTNVEVANVEATNVEAAKVEATNVEATNVEATNDEAADIETRDNTNAIELVNISDSTLLPNDLCALGMLQSDLNEKYKGADWQTVKGSVIKNGSYKQMSASSIDADTNPNVEISNRFESLIYEGDEESDDQEIPNTTKTKEKLSLQQKGFGKNQMSESDDKAAQSN